MMCCGDVLIDRVLSDGEVASSLNQLFSASQGEVLVVDDIASPNLKLTPLVKVICEKRQVKGSFPTALSFYIHDEKIRRLDEQQVIKQLCVLLNCSCLISDNSNNPYSWLLAQATGSTQHVSLDPVMLDDEEAYIIK